MRACFTVLIKSISNRNHQVLQYKQIQSKNKEAFIAIKQTPLNM